MRAALLAVLAACKATGTFACETDDQCRGGPTPGICEPTGFCAFGDTTCPSGERYDPYAGGGFGGECVPENVGPDGGTGARDIPHLPASAETLGTADLQLGDVTIDTTQLAVPNLPSGVTVDHVAQDPNGPELMVIHARDVQISAGATVHVIGSRPLVILARRITVDGKLDASANLDTPGGGGYGPAMGGGAGGAGTHNGIDHDSGGGGGGFGTAAGAGGAAGTMAGCASGATATAGSAGIAMGSDVLGVLEGGAGGASGAMGMCTASNGGAGGGAVQLSAYETIAITGVIAAGGGGGLGGVFCNNNDAGAGSGGGAGGAIYLDAPMVMHDGLLAANGGGGGGGGCGPGGSGTPGGNGTADTMAAAGGQVGGSCGAPGGAGAVGGTAPEAGVDNLCDGNGGGGGGAVGRIVAHARTVLGGGPSTPPLVTDGF
jgi:hypothetical protein